MPAERDAYEKTRRALREARRRRWLSVVVSLCLLAALASPVAVFRPFRDVPLEGWGVRGSLAANEQFLEAMAGEAAQWSALNTSGDEVEHSRLVYAEDNGELRWVVAVVRLSGLEGQPPTGGERQAGADFARTQLVLMSGPPGAKPHQLRGQAVTFVSSGGGARTPWLPWPEAPTIAWLHGTAGGHATLFVLGPPDTRAMAYASRPEFHADGTWDRSWRRIQSHDGVASVTLSYSQGRAGLVRLRGPGETAVVRAQPRDEPLQPPDGFAPSEVFPDIAGFPPAGRRSVLPPELFSAVAKLGRVTRIPAGRFDVQLQWHSAERSAWLLGAMLPDGASFQVVAINGRSYVSVVPRGETDRPVAVAFGRPSRVLVIAPGQQGGTVRLREGDETVAMARIDETGSAVARAIADTAKAYEQLRFRVFDQGQQVYGGDVRAGSRPPWLRID